MRVELKDFQVNAVATLYGRLQQMRSAYERDDALSSVCLSSITGSGKTVMCAAVIEALFFGNDELGLPSDERATVLWVSDSPSLNEQTRMRFAECSDRLADWPGDTRYLEEVTNDFCASHEKLVPRHVYFLSKDLLGKGNRLVKGGEENSGRVFWDMLDRTIRDPSVNLYLFIDEAHRGFGVKRGVKAEDTIYGYLVNGFEGRAPTPMVVGVSATPERFEARMDAMEDRDRKARVSVSPEAVQESGLIKDAIELRVPESSEPLEHQYLTMAAERFRLFREQWDVYCLEQSEPHVWPLMVVQVRDNPSSESLRDLCDQIISIVPGLNRSTSFANVFGDHKDLSAGQYLIPYMRPEIVQSSTHVQVLFAKEAISNGWDCPRAEVLVSLRNRKDPTYIAQLIGRMVRTPLARRVDANDLLNSIACYLPRFDRETTQGVVDYLTGKTDEMGCTVSKVTVQPVMVKAAKPRTQEDYDREMQAYLDAEHAHQEFEANQSGHQNELATEDGQFISSTALPGETDLATDLGSDSTGDDLNGKSTNGKPDEGLVSLIVDGATISHGGSVVKPVPKTPPKPLTARDRSFTEEEYRGIRAAFDSIKVQRNPKKARNEFRCLLDTATLFVEASIDESKAESVNKGFARKLESDLVLFEDKVKPAKEEVERTNTKVIRIDKLRGNEVSEFGEQILVDDAGIAKAADQAERVFSGKELTNAFRKRLMDQGRDLRDINLALAAACRTDEVVESLKTWAMETRATMFDKAAAEYNFLDERYKQKYRDLESETGSKLVTRIQWPEKISIPSKGRKWKRHIVQDEDGLCPLDLNEIESFVVERELARERTVAFYRNPSESYSPLAFSIPYDSPGGRKALHPDFIFFVRDHEGMIRPSIIDPHGAYLADAVPKLKGYVRYLRDYPDTFIQVLSIAPVAGENSGYRMLDLLYPMVQDAILGFEGDMAEELYRGALSHAYE